MSVSSKARVLVALAPLLFAAGCGIQATGDGGGFSISAPQATVSTTGQLQFKAAVMDGGAAAVVWTVSSAHSNGSLGPGTIDATGLYTPPSALADDAMTVQVTAHLQSDPSQTAGETITVTPGFLQTLLPENAALAPGATLEVSAQIAEVDAGTVRWSLSDSSMGTLGTIACQHSKQAYTVCRTTYTAPSTVNGSQSVYVIATVNDSNTQTRLHVLLNPEGVNSSALMNQVTQSGPILLGSSGSNDTDYDVFQDAAGNNYIADCCGGTLGALAEDAEHNQYILSNNHVLAESDQAKIGDTIDQPGLIDNACRPMIQQGSTLRPVGTLRYYVPLSTNQTNVDAALAAVTPGAVNPDGSILQLGTAAAGNNPLLSASPPVAGNGEMLNAENLSTLRVVKSGRTTGLTCSTVETVDLAVKVDYYKDCAETQPYYTKTFTGQIGIGGNSFSDSGDSGSLVLDASNAQPIGLFYAGGTDGRSNGLSIANPIGDVLKELGTQTGSKLSIVGTNTPHTVMCFNYDTNAEANDLLQLSPAAQDQAANVAHSAALQLVNHEKGVLGTAVGKSADNPGDPAVIIYVDKNRPNTVVPQSIFGVRTVVVFTDTAGIANGIALKLPAATPGIQLSASTLHSAELTASEYSQQLLADPAIFGVGVAQSRDDAREAALLVLVDMNKIPKSMPSTLGGLRVRYLELHRFHVTQSKYAGAHPVSSCSLKSLKPAAPR